MSTLFMTEAQYNEQQDETWDIRASNTAEADRAYAHIVGAGQPNRAWILSDRDVWYANPAYRGPKCIASVHPENAPDEVFENLHAPCAAHARCLHGFGDPVFGPVRQIATVTVDDNIPF